MKKAQYTGIIQPVIGVSAHMGAALRHQHPLSLLRQSPGTHSAGIARAHDYCIISLRQGDPTFLLKFKFFAAPDFPVPPDKSSCRTGLTLELNRRIRTESMVKSPERLLKHRVTTVYHTFGIKKMKKHLNFYAASSPISAALRS